MKKIFALFGLILLLGAGCKNSEKTESMQRQIDYLTRRVSDLEVQVESQNDELSNKNSEVEETADEALKMIKNLCGELDRC